MSPLEVTLEEAIALLKQPKTRGRGTPKEPLRVYENKSPVTEGEVKILDGRFGPYVTDGETNASLRKGMDPKEMTFEAALDLLAERAAKGPIEEEKEESSQEERQPRRRQPKRRQPRRKRPRKAKKKGVPKKKS